MLWRYERERAKQSAFAAAVAFGWMYAAMLMLCCAMIAMVAALFLLLRDQMPAELALVICAAVLAISSLLSAKAGQQWFRHKV